MSMNLRRTKTASAASCAIVLGLTLSACGGDSSGGEGSDANLRFSWWGSDPRHEATQEIISDFNAEHQDITVEGEYSDWSGYWNKLATMTAADDAPDVITMDVKYLQEYAGRGALVDLTTLENLDLSAFPEAALNAGAYEDGIYGLSTGQNAYVVMANADVFEKAGVEMPDDTTWTWEDYYDISAQISENLDDVSGTAYGPQYVDLKIWLRQQGQTLYNSEEGALGYEIGAAASWFEHLLTVRDEGGGVSAAEYTEEQSGSFEAGSFPTNKAAMGWYWTNQLDALRTASDSDIRILRVPSTTGEAAENGMYFKASMYWSISSQSEDTPAAATFVDSLANDDAAAKLMLVDRGVPANPEMTEAIKPELGEADQRVVDFLDEVEPTMADAPAPPPVGASGGQDVIKRYVSEVLFDNLTAQEAAEQMTAELESMIQG